LSETKLHKTDFFGQEVTIVGSEVEVGQTAPDFNAQSLDWSTVNILRETKGKVRIIGSLPSLSTPVCDKETKHFNQIAETIGDDIVIIMISMDLPWTQKHWCTTSRVDQVRVLSDHINADFGIKYGVLLDEPRILRRAIFVIGKDDVLKYVAYMPSLSDEPDYEAVLQAAKEAFLET